jgi:hypothetical protein
MSRGIIRVAVLSAAVAGITGCGSSSPSGATKPASSGTAQLEQKLKQEFSARFDQQALVGQAREGAASPDATPDYAVSCIQRSGNDYSCILTTYNSGPDAYGPPAPTATDPSRRKKDEQGFDAVWDHATGKVQYTDPQ